MFRYKMAGILEQVWNALSFEARGTPRGRPWEARNPRSQTMQGLAAKNETYIAPTQLIMVSTPFFRWLQ